MPGPFSGGQGSGKAGAGVFVTLCFAITVGVRFCVAYQEQAHDDLAVANLRTFEMCSNAVLSVRAAEEMRGRFIRGCEQVCGAADESQFPLGKVGCILHFATQNPIVEEPPAPAQDCDALAQPPRAEMGKLAAVADGVALAAIEARPAQEACAQARAQYPRDWRFTAYAGRAAEAGGDLEAAAKLYRDAADHGSAVGQYHLGLLYRTGGGGLIQDRYMSAVYLKYAAGNDYEPAARALAADADSRP